MAKVHKMMLQKLTDSKLFKATKMAIGATLIAFGLSSMAHNAQAATTQAFELATHTKAKVLASHTSKRVVNSDGFYNYDGPEHVDKSKGVKANSKRAHHVDNNNKKPTKQRVVSSQKTTHMQKQTGHSGNNAHSGRSNEVQKDRSVEKQNFNTYNEDGPTVEQIIRMQNDIKNGNISAEEWSDFSAKYNDHLISKVNDGIGKDKSGGKVFTKEQVYYSIMNAVSGILRENGSPPHVVGKYKGNGGGTTLGQETMFITISLMDYARVLSILGGEVNGKKADTKTIFDAFLVAKETGNWPDITVPGVKPLTELGVNAKALGGKIPKIGEITVSDGSKLNAEGYGYEIKGQDFQVNQTNAGTYNLNKNNVSKTVISFIPLPNKYKAW